MLWTDFLKQSARRTPDKIALIEGSRQLSYRELDALTNRFANALLDLGLAKGARVAIQSANCVEYPVTFFGTARAGYVSAHISARATVRDLAFMLNKIQASALVVDEARASGAIEALAGLDHPCKLIVVGLPRQDSKCLTFEAFVADHPSTHPGIQIDETDPVAITFTGGTTGLPKGVLVNHRSRTTTVHTAAAHFGVNETDVVCTATPLFHAAGLFVVFVPAIALGASVVLQGAWDVPEFMANVKQHGITSTLLVPSQLNDLVSHPSFDAKALASLTKVGYAGAPMSKALFMRIRSALPHVAFTENYGQTETGPIAVRSPWHPEDKISTVGRPSFNVEVDVLDPNGTPVPRGRVGEIVTRGAHVFDAYYNEPEQTATAFRTHDDWLWTGDVGFIDDEGYLTIVDRSKDMLISGGENVYPAEIENTLYQHEAVAECAVFGVPDDRWGEVPAAHVVIKKGSTTTAEDLIGFCAQRISRHKRPRLVKLVDSLPRTAVGKIQKAVLREPYWRGRDRKI
jgi:acyl-CoA synthetase (AMP-forming)/AMP-acid ligase II